MGRIRKRNAHIAFATSACCSLYRTPRVIWMRPRVRGFWANFYHNADEFTWIQTLRMKKQTFMYIFEQFQHKLVVRYNPLSPRPGVPAQEKLGMALYYLASNAEFRVVGNVFGVSASTVYKYVHLVVENILDILTPKWVTLADEEECVVISSDFEAR